MNIGQIGSKLFIFRFLACQRFLQNLYRVAHMFSPGFIVVKPSKVGDNIWATLYLRWNFFRSTYRSPFYKALPKLHVSAQHLSVYLDRNNQNSTSFKNCNIFSNSLELPHPLNKTLISHDEKLMTILKVCIAYLW